MSTDYRATSLHHLTPGTVLEGRYEITGVLGEGGFATVYKARQLNIQRDVAIKILNPGTDARTARSFEERFLREARTAAQINHSNVVSIYDFGFTDQTRQPYIAMEMLDGHDLEEELQQNGPMESQRALRLFCEALEALGEAHKLGIVHKDLKPSNLFLCAPGSRRELLKIVDFGIARVHELEGKKLTGTGQILGTPQYLAPEYIQSQIATPALDVYQMGLILIEMLTGKAVVDFDNPYQCLMVHGSGALEVPTTLVSGPIGAVLLKSLEHDHTQRYVDAYAFHEALVQIDSSTIPVIPPSEIRRKISEVSGNLRAVAVSGTADTGTFEARKAGDKASRQRVPTVVGGGLGAMAPTGAQTPVSVGQSGPYAQQHGGGYPSGQISQPIDLAPSGMKSRLPIFVGVAAVVAILLLAIVGLGLYATFSDDDPTAAAQNSANKASVNKAGIVVDKKSPAEEEKDDAKEPDKGALAAKEPAEEKNPGDDKPEIVAQAVPVAITATPDNADIFVNDKKVGSGKATWTFESADAKAVAIRIEARGYDTFEGDLSPSDTEFAQELKRSRGARQVSNDRQVVKKDPPKEDPPKKDPPKEDPPKKDRPKMDFVD